MCTCYVSQVIRYFTTVCLHVLSLHGWYHNAIMLTFRLNRSQFVFLIGSALFISYQSAFLRLLFLPCTAVELEFLSDSLDDSYYSCGGYDCVS